MGLRRQLERLEEVYGGGWRPPCDACGGGGNLGGDEGEATYELTFPGDRSDDDLGVEPQEEYCGSCGRQLTWVLTFPDEPRQKRSSWRR